MCKASHAVFPTATRVNSASLTTGCYPGHHGIVDNELYVPSIDAQKAVTCADWAVLRALAEAEGGRLLDAPTIGEILRSAGKRMASCGSGSPGTTYLTNPTVTGPVVNWATAWPNATKEEIRRRYGGFLDSTATSSERNQFVLRTIYDYLVPVVQPDLLTIWLTEPDHSQHRHGIASPEALAALAELDAQLERFLQTLKKQIGKEGLTCILLSDHGFSTISEGADPGQVLAEAGFKRAPDSNEIICTTGSLYLTGKARERIAEIVRFLASEPWVGALFLRDDLNRACPEAMYQSAVFGSHRRSAEIMFSRQWSAKENAYGVPGSVAVYAGMAATHGSASPYAINNCLVAWGKGIRQATVSTVPCSIVDVAPTVLHLLGVPPPADMDGRVLHELLEGDSPPEAMKVSHWTRETAYDTSACPTRQVARYSSAEGHDYLDQVTLIQQQSPL
jgi:arylsulfatase A-like enzyme